MILPVSETVRAGRGEPTEGREAARGGGGWGSHQVEVSPVHWLSLTPSRGECFATLFHNKYQQVSTSVNNYQALEGISAHLIVNPLYGHPVASQPYPS